MEEEDDGLHVIEPEGPLSAFAAHSERKEDVPEEESLDCSEDVQRPTTSGTPCGGTEAPPVGEGTQSTTDVAPSMVTEAAPIQTGLVHPKDELLTDVTRPHGVAQPVETVVDDGDAQIAELLRRHQQQEQAWEQDMAALHTRLHNVHTSNDATKGRLQEAQAALQAEIRAHSMTSARLLELGASVHAIDGSQDPHDEANSSLRHTEAEMQESDSQRSTSELPLWRHMNMRPSGHQRYTDAELAPPALKELQQLIDVCLSRRLGLPLSTTAEKPVTTTPLLW